MTNEIRYVFASFAALVILASSFLSHTTAKAQAPQNLVTSFNGTLKGFQRGAILVTKDDGTEMTVIPPPDISKFVFSANAKPAFLSKGMMVRFSGEFTGQGVPLSPISKVEIFRPVPTQSMRGSSREQFIPGVRPDRHGGPKQKGGSGKYSVVGALMGIAPNGAMMVQAGKIPVRAQLAQDAQFLVRFNNLSLAKEGDLVTVNGFYEASNETRVLGDTVRITTDRVFGEPVEKPKPTRRNTPPSTSEKPESEAETKEAE